MKDYAWSQPRSGLKHGKNYWVIRVIVTFGKSQIDFDYEIISKLTLIPSRNVTDAHFPNLIERAPTFTNRFPRFFYQTVNILRLCETRYRSFIL